MRLPKNFLGLDLARVLDFTALVLVERLVSQGEWDAVYFTWKQLASLRVRYVERMARRTPYPEVIERVRKLVWSPEVAGDCVLVVDGTGHGQAVIDFLEGARLGCPIWNVQIGSGDRERYAEGSYRVPKRDLIAGTQVLFQRGKLEIAKGIPQGETLVREMSEMRVKVLPSGYEQFEGRGEHDDLVLALSLACWGAGKAEPAVEGGIWQRQGVPLYGPGRIL